MSLHTVIKTYGHDLGLSCVFRQWRAESHCRHLHGYALSVELEFGAQQLDERGWVIDFGGLKHVKNWLVEIFDHRLLLAADDPQLSLLLALGPETADVASPLVLSAVGCEAFASFIASYVGTWLAANGYVPRVELLRVTVAEHGGNAVTYCPDRLPRIAQP